MIAELLLVKFEEPMPMLRLLLPHSFEHLGRSGIILPQSFGEIGVDTCVFFFQLNRKRQNFALAEALKVSHPFLGSTSAAIKTSIEFARYRLRRKIPQVKLQMSAEIAVVVALDGEGDVQQLARLERITFEPFGHPPAERLDAASQSRAVVHAARQLQLQVLALQYPRRTKRARPAGNEDRLWISRSKWLQAADRIPQRRPDFIEWQFQIVFERRLHLLWSETFRGEAVQPPPQLRHMLGGQRKPNRLGVSAKTREQFGTMLQRVQQMEAGNGASRTVRLISVARNHHRRSLVALHQPRGADADHSAVPTFAVHHQANGVREFRRLLQLRSYGFQDARLFLLAVAVQAVEVFRDLQGLRRHFFGEQLNHVASHVHSSRRIHARSNAEGDIGCRERTACSDAGDLQQRAQPRIHRMTQRVQPEAGENAVFAGQRYRIGNGRNGNHFQK